MSSALSPKARASEDDQSRARSGAGRWLLEMGSFQRGSLEHCPRVMPPLVGPFGPMKTFTLAPLLIPSTSWLAGRGLTVR